MDELIAFLNARLDEEENGADAVHLPLTCSSIDRDGDFDPAWCDCGYPARVLREVAAKRAILAEHQPWQPMSLVTWCQRCHERLDSAREDEDQCTPVDWPCPTVRTLIAVWNGHPGYRPYWAP